MTARERVARAWHAGSDHAADGSPFGGPLCNCAAVAGRIMPMLTEARVEAVRRAAQDIRLINSCATAAAQGWLTRYANDIETEGDVMSISETECRHCGDRIVPRRFLGRDTWTHQPAGAAFQDGEHLYCHLAAATPKEDRHVDQ